MSDLKAIAETVDERMAKRLEVLVPYLNDKLATDLREAIMVLRSPLPSEADARLGATVRWQRANIIAGQHSEVGNEPCRCRACCILSLIRSAIDAKETPNG